MKKLENFNAFEEHKLSQIFGGEISWADTRYANGGHDEHQICHEGNRRYIDARYNCDLGKFDDTIF